MEKRLPHHDLRDFQREFSHPARLRMTATATSNMRALGMTRQEVVDLVQSMTRSHFYKSMTAYLDATRWQDVYHVPWRGLTLYVKLTVDEMGHLLLQLKEK